MSHLLTLIERQYEGTKKCRQSDSFRGSKIIPDYDDVHSTVENDDVILSLANEIQLLSEDMVNILNELTE